MTPGTLRLLIVEDSEDDALLLVRELHKGGYAPDFTRVETPQDLRFALDDGPWDAVFADYTLPAFTGLDALRIVRESGVDLPFILVSGVIGEEQAVEAMKAGAHDFILKGRFSRLVPALERELADAEGRRERRRAEEELARYREHLEEMVEERTAQLARAKSEAEAADRAKSVFLSNMTHEMRTPLTGVIGVIELLLTDELTDQQRHLLELAKSSADALKQLVNDILDFTLVLAGRMSFRLQPFDLRGCLRTAVDLAAAEAGRKGLGFRLEIDDGVPETMVGDEGRLRQVLLSLTGNAVKFTDKGEIAVSVRPVPDPARTGRELLQFAVRDTGIGIPADHLERIFGSFTQADMSITKRFGGTGLGLALAREIARRMGGDIRVESRSGEGSVFTFTLPLGGAEAEQQ